MPDGFAAADLAAKVRAISANPAYTTRKGTYDIGKLRAKYLVASLPNDPLHVASPSHPTPLGPSQAW